MSKLEKRPDQAGNLRTRMIDDYKEIHGDYPSRSELHKDTVKKQKRKMKYPIISILALIFILILIVILFFSFYYFNNNNDIKTSIGNKNSSGDETVYISKGKSYEIETDTMIPKEEETDDGPLTEETSKDEAEVSTNDRKTSETEAKIETKTEAKTKTETKTETETIIQKNQETDSTEYQKNATDSTHNKDSEYREVKSHKVAAGETLFKIAIQYYKNRSGEEIIRQYNGIEANNIYEGQILKIPLK
ncbi:LysM peptidoglycan-binding domain-containing protein [Metabacillus litoralis]|jgi:LysM repeat protein|uniref:LysM peptidoglycan-binding domain-containing protein n=1 Tax=Metabacillus litoralis TaxID=152268 RepID=UPI00204202BD|nr:LysM peptidoglycan-binding domain-containing protein [Metabacillus litoralis]MCM3652154.1 LysM peptidoglycan-binding domain-containing protein [Metabacillus litoralis]